MLAPFRVLRGTECDILPDGSLDLPDDVLAELDWVQVGLHAGQRGAAQELTRRASSRRCGTRPRRASAIRRAASSTTGRRTRSTSSAVFEVALETGVALEVNGLPDRLDLRDEHVRLALEAGVPIVCSTDAHSMRGLGNMRLSVATARRGGAAA